MDASLSKTHLNPADSFCFSSPVSDMNINAPSGVIVYLSPDVVVGYKREQTTQITYLNLLSGTLRFRERNFNLKNLIKNPLIPQRDLCLISIMLLLKPEQIVTPLKWLVVRMRGARCHVGSLFTCCRNLKEGVFSARASCEMTFY